MCVCTYECVYYVGAWVWCYFLQLRLDFVSGKLRGHITLPVSLQMSAMDMVREAITNEIKTYRDLR